MKNRSFLEHIRSGLRSRTATMLFAAGAVILLAGGSVNGARAALTYYSEDYVTRVSMHNIGVSIVENDGLLSWRDYSDRSDGSWDENTGVLSLSTADPDGTVKIGKNYQENLKVRNSGDIDCYIRVVLHRYWTDPDGSRNQDLAPDLVVLNGLGGDSWIVDEQASTDERTVLYYTKPVAPGQDTAPFLASVMADPSLADMVTEHKSQNGKYTEITTTFDYDGVKIGLDIEADAVQTHSPEDAIWSAWGRRVNISGSGTLSLR